MPHISEGSFTPLPGEELPNQDFSNPARIKTLLEYMARFPVHGYSGFPEEAFRNIRHSSFAHPTNDDVWISSGGEKVTHQDAVEAIKWAGRHITKLIQEEFPPDQYEVLWNRTPLRWRWVSICYFLSIFCLFLSFSNKWFFDLKH